MNANASFRLPVKWRVLFVVACLTLSTAAFAQMRILPLGDSITHGGQNYASFRYSLWFALTNAGYNVEFVGTRNTLFSDSIPTADWYPDYFTSFDRDHSGYWGARTDQIAVDISAIATATTPNIVLVHLGTNDIGQLGANGIANADTNLRLIIESLRTAQPDVTILLAQIIDIGVTSGYGENADQVTPLNMTIATIATELSTFQSPIILVDQNTGFDVNTMMQPDALHPNLLGENQMATTWFGALSNILVSGNIPPSIELTSPAGNSVIEEGSSLTLEANATDGDGSVVDVSFYLDGILLSVDDSAPYSAQWNNVSTGSYVVTAAARDNENLVTTTPAVTVTVLPITNGQPVIIQNAGFELPTLEDGVLFEGPGNINGWEFTGTANTFTGIFNPPAGSYSAASANNTPTGTGDGANAAYLFNDGGANESVAATQFLTEVLEANYEYVLTVAIGKFLPDQPYSFSTYGGYQIELLAGSTVIALNSNSIDPVVDSFADAFCAVSSNTLTPDLLGQPLGIRLTISATESDRSTHFDRVRLSRIATDEDGDGIDLNVDNCTLVSNPRQLDSDGDLIGNRCDPDIAVPNDCVVNFMDYVQITNRFLSTSDDVDWNPDADLDGDEQVNFVDLAIFTQFFLQPPGPSALGCN